MLIWQIKKEILSKKCLTLCLLYGHNGDRDIDVIHTQLDERSSANEDLIGYYMLPQAHIFAVY